MDPILTLRASFVVSGLIILVVRALNIPSLSSGFLNYGSRGTSSSSASDQSKDASSRSKDGTSNARDSLWFIQVPHSWFASFYVTSTALSSYWIFEILTNGSVFKSLALAVTDRSPHQSMSTHQVFLVWALMSIQGARRLYESLYVSRPSNSSMWVGHWIMGIAYYAGVSIAVWIEGSPALLDRKTPQLTDLRFTAPTFRTFVSLPFFLLASGAQNDAHRYLASLRPVSPPSSAAKPVYKIPEHPLFHTVVCPHYTAECAIYLALTVMAAPKGNWINWTLASVLFFVVVNLGITADGTKRWYESKFGEASVREKWRLIPYVF